MPRVTDRHGRPVAGHFPAVTEALVVDNVDPDEMGRVKVQFPNQPDLPEAYWARVLSPMAGRNRGWMTIPEIGDEVLVAFAWGDVQHAVVLGNLYNGVDTPPYANEDEQNNLRVFQSRSGHRLTFDDTPGAERVELVLHSEEIRVIWDSTEQVLSIYCGGDVEMTVGETLSMKTRELVVEAEQDVKLQAGRTFTAKAGQEMSFKGGQELVLQAPAININMGASAPPAQTLPLPAHKHPPAR